MNNLTQQLLIKMGLRDEPSVTEKTNELIRLVDLKSANVPLHINEYGKVVLCADIAATLLCVPFDNEQALKISGLRKTQYLSNKRMFEKLLNLNKIFSVKDVCTILNVNEVSKKAEEILEFYRKQMPSDNIEFDNSHPQYVAMATYMACKMSRKKISKPKFIAFSNLRPMQWQKLEQEWEKALTQCYTILNRQQKISINANECKTNEMEHNYQNDEKHYEIWKQRILAIAFKKLNN